jgi:membrane fusion protein, multidrug efflux system
MAWRMVLLAVVIALSATVAEAFQADGLLEPHRVIKVGSPQQGVLATVDVERGDTVKAGQVVATLHSDVERATMDLKKANKEFTDRKKQRLEPLFTKELIAAHDMDEAETGRAVADAEYRHASAVVNRMSIRSPISGVVVERYLSQGEFVENQPIMKIAQIDPLNVEVILPSSRYRQIRLGARARVIPEDNQKGSFTAQIKIIDRVIDAASGTFGVRLELPNPDYRIPAGLKCKVIFSEK